MNEMVSDAVDLPTAAPPPADTQHDVADDTPEAGSVEQLKAAVERSLKELHPVDLDSPGGPKAAVPPDAARAPGSVPADRAEQREEQPPPITRPDDMPRASSNLTQFNCAEFAGRRASTGKRVGRFARGLFPQTAR